MPKRGYRTTTTVLGQKLSSPVFDKKSEVKDWLSEIAKARKAFKRGDEISAKQRKILQQAKFQFEVYEGDIYLDDLAADFLRLRAEHYVSSTASFNLGHLRKYILPDFKGRNIYSIKPSEVRNYFQNLKLKKRIGRDESENPVYEQTSRTASAQTIKAIKVTFSLLFEHAIDTGMVGENFVNPVKKAKKKKSREASGDEEMKFWFEKSDIRSYLQWTYENNPRLFAFSTLILNSGLRKSEALGLTYASLNERDGSVEISQILEQVSRSVVDRTKAGARIKRFAPLNKEAISAIKYWRDQSPHPGKNSFIFCRDDGSPYSPRQIITEFQRACAGAGVDDIDIHGMRHTFATHFIMEGGRLEVLQKILGHRSITTTQRYVHIVEKFIKTKHHVVSFGIDLEQDREHGKAP